MSSEGYGDKAGCKNGIALVQKNAPDDARYERKTAANGKFYFVLKSANHQVIGTSQMYADDAGRDNGIASVKANAPNAETEDTTG